MDETNARKIQRAGGIISPTRDVQLRSKFGDLISFTEKVKTKFYLRPHLYYDYLGILKEFQTKKIDYCGLTDRLSALFKDHKDLNEWPDFEFLYESMSEEEWMTVRKWPRSVMKSQLEGFTKGFLGTQEEGTRQLDANVCIVDRRDSYQDIQDIHFAEPERLLKLLSNEDLSDPCLTCLTPGFLSEITNKILDHTTSGHDKIILLKCFKLVFNQSNKTLETILSPAEKGKGTENGENKHKSIFEAIHCDEDLLNIVAETIFNLIVKEHDEESQMTALVNLLRVHAESISSFETGDNCLALFLSFFEKLKMTELREESGYAKDLEGWRDRYGRTFLMRLADSQEASKLNFLTKKIIEKHIFCNEFIDTKTEQDLGTKFNLQHRQGLASENKERNTVLTEQNTIKVKRVQIFDKKTRIYERIFSSKDSQEKVLSKRKIGVIESGEEKQTRIMVTGKKIPADEHHFNLPAVSVDGDVSDYESRDGVDILTDELENVHIQPQIVDSQENVFKPEHFDKTSIVTGDSTSFKTKENKYRFAPSASTLELEPYSEVKPPGEYFTTNTTLLLVACRTNNWALAESILDVYVLKSLMHKDSKGWNALHLAIMAEKPDVCEKILKKIEKENTTDIHLLKTDGKNGKNALTLVTEMINNGAPLDMVEKIILEKTGQKKKNDSDMMEKIEKLQLFRGKNYGFLFECLESSATVWTCKGQNCNVEINVREDFTISDPDHYERHTCKHEKEVRHDSGKLQIDQFQYVFKKDSENNESRVFTCMDGCDSTVKINLGTLVLEEEEGHHSCPVSLMLELDKDCGMFDGDVFKKNTDVDCHGTWYNDHRGCGCKILVYGEELKIKVHQQCKEHKPQEEVDDLENIEEEEDGGMFGILF